MRSIITREVQYALSLGQTWMFLRTKIRFIGANGPGKYPFYQN